MMDRTASTPAAALKRRRWLPRFGLRTLLVLLTLAAVFLGFVGRRWQQAQRQSAAVAYIESLGGYVTYDYDQHPMKPGGPSPWAERLPFLGIDVFHGVIAVDVDDNVYYPDDAEGRRLSRQTSEKLATFTRLKRLSIGGVKLEPGRNSARRLRDAAERNNPRRFR